MILHSDVNKDLVSDLRSKIQYVVKISIWGVIIVYYLVIHDRGSVGIISKHHLITVDTGLSSAAPGVKNKCFRKYLVVLTVSGRGAAVTFIWCSVSRHKGIFSALFQWKYFVCRQLYDGLNVTQIKANFAAFEKYLIVLIILTRCTVPVKNARRICFLMILNCFSGKIRVWMIQVSSSHSG